MTTAMEVSVEGIEPAVARLQQLGADILGIIEPPLLRLGYRVESRAKEYPPQRPTDYVRTMKLGQSWFTDPVVRSGDALRLNMGSNRDYAIFVRSDERQAWMHRGHWETDEEILNDEMPGAVGEFRAAILGAVGGP